ncbi:MAG: uridine kinase [Bacteroidetes bacterium]|nr:uridine kinase [Bacteroidota bacterium]
MFSNIYLIFTKTITLIIGFCGGTGAGKSTLVEYVAQFLGKDNTLILAQDHYYKHLPERTFKERAKINFDHPDALDFDLMVSDLQKLKQGIAIERPVYSFAEHLRMNETVTIPPKQSILVEGILVFAHKHLHPLFDYKVYIEANEDLRVRRRVERDVNYRGRTKEEVQQRFKTTLHSMHKTFIAPNKEKADIVIANNGAIENAKTALTKWLKSSVR